MFFDNTLKFEKKNYFWDLNFTVKASNIEDTNNRIIYYSFFNYLQKIPKRLILFF